MQDGGIAAGADFEANTDYVSGNPKVGIIWDLKDVYSVERMDVICRNGGASNYYLGKAYIYGRASDSDEWIDIGSVTASTDMKKTLWDATVTDSANKRDVYQFDLIKGQYRYIKVEFTAVHQGYFSEMYIFGEEIEKKSLNVISNNERINSGWYADNGYELTYSNSGADYLWTTTGLTTPLATSISDEQDVFDTTIVRSGETAASRPDMQDGGIAAGADYEANTDYNSTGSPRLGIVWDLKNVYRVDRLDIVNKYGTQNYYLGKVYIYGKASASDEWTSIGSVTASTEMKKSLWDTTVTDNANKRELYEFDLVSGNYRYIKVEIIAKSQANISEMYIFGEKVADEEKTYPLSFGESEYTILDTNYNIIDELKGAEIVSISGNIINNDSSDVSVKVYSAIYDSTNKLIAVEVTETITVLSDGAKWENTFEELGGLPENAYLVNFAWADNLTPLAQAQNK